MKSIYRYFLKVRRELKILLLISIAGYFFIEIFLSNYGEIFPGSEKVGVFFSRLSTAYISAFIFYFIVVHIKTERDKHNVNEFVGHEVYGIITAGHLLIQPFMEKKDKSARFEYLSTGDLSSLLRSIDRQASEAPYSINGKPGTWLQWYEHLKRQIEVHQKNILIRYSHLDSRLIKLLTRLEQSLFLAQWEKLYDFSYDRTFGTYYIQIKFFLDHLRELEKYADENLKQYQYLTGDFVGRMP